MSVEYPLRALAQLVGAEIARGDPERVIARVAPVEFARPDEITFVAKPKYLPKLKASSAGAVMISDDLLGREDAEIPEATAILVVREPYVAFARVAQAFESNLSVPVGVHSSALIDPSAHLASDVTVGPFAVVGPRVRLAPGVVLYAGVHLGADARVGEGSVLHDHVVVRHGCVIGARCVLHAGAVIGADGFGFAQEHRGNDVEHIKIPQVGRVVVEDDVEIGANTCVDRAALGTTRIGAGTKIDNLVQIGHNVELGPNCIVIAQAGVAGSTRIGARTVLAAQVGIAGHLEVGEDSVLFAQAGLMDSIPPKSHFVGTPARPKIEFFRGVARVAKLDSLVRRVKKLERLLGVEGTRDRKDDQ